eukprot:Skav204862  [mRNA]  locus=scaffold2222:54031:56790:+ [translate_table: standard]
MPPAESSPFEAHIQKRPELRFCVCCGFAISFIGYVCFPHNQLYSTSTLVHTRSSRVSVAGLQSRDLVIEENWDRNATCFDTSSFPLTVAFNLDWSGVINHRLGLLHGFTVAYLLGAQNVVEPRLRIELSHESSSVSGTEVSLDQYYDTDMLRSVLKTLNLTLLPDRPQKVKTVHFDKLRRDIQGETMQWICSRIREGLVQEDGTNNVMVDLGSVPGLLRADGRNLGLIAFIDKHLEYNTKIRVAAQSILGKLPPIFNGLHLPVSDEAYKTSDVAIPENIVPKMIQLGFQQETTVFVASGVQMHRLVPLLQPYNIATIVNFSGSMGTLDEQDFDLINQLVLEKANKFTGFSLASESIAISGHRWLEKGLCDKSYDSDTFFDPWPSPLFIWRGTLPFKPSCYDEEKQHDDEKQRDDGKQHDDGKPRDSRAILPKRIFSDTCRFVFFAGLEGTGHKYWSTVLGTLNPSTQWGCPLSKQLYDGAHKGGYWSTYQDSTRSSSATRIKQLMTDANRSLSNHSIVALNVACYEGSGMMSYPNWGGPSRAIQVPDVRALAHLAEDAGFDLRIVLMLRDPQKVVNSGLRRKYEGDFLHAIKRYTSTLAFLRVQLDLLDPSFIKCWMYETPTAGISDLLTFMGSRHDPNDFKAVIEKNYLQNHISQTPSPSAKLPEAWGTLMATYFDLKAKYCRF